MKHLFCFAVLLMFPVFGGEYQVPEADAALERELDYYCTNRSGSPAEFRADYVRSAFGQIVRGQLLRRKAVPSDAEARRILTGLRDEIRTGWTWKEAPREVTIPYLSRAPEIDGCVNPAEWADALVFREEYLRSSVTRRTPAAVWRIGYEREYLYWSAEIPDSDVQVNSRKPYMADSLELFVMPEIRLRTYCEVVIHPGPGSYTRWCTTGHGGVYQLCDWTPEGFHYTVKRTESGWSAEARLAFRELPGYLLGNRPEAGQQIRFQLIRTDLSGGRRTYTTPVPFLYDGHNIYGYIRATLGKQNRN